jgi:hypothetical protein
MARKAAKAREERVEPEDESQEAPEPAAQETGAQASDKAVSKADAARAALAQGIESPEDAVAFIKKRYGIELGRQHFSSIKSQLKKKEREGGGKADGRTGRRGRPKGSTVQPAGGYLAPPAKPPADGGADLIDTLEALKPLVAQYGAEKVKRIVDLLG